ncbi:hypothetical protein [Roseibacillus persicicus]|uniref:hypothetical protein n=1 Tax=Roseibacillus persicicus TaxID=454148 RepID=UPI0028104DE0|nr:hypothetical protein [Roseibacillus persicicus]MDQ8192701.1 hypothetical protein [Roseibacillus persicicus]
MLFRNLWVAICGNHNSNQTIHLDKASYTYFHNITLFNLPQPRPSPHGALTYDEKANE